MSKSMAETSFEKLKDNKSSKDGSKNFRNNHRHSTTEVVAEKGDLASDKQKSQMSEKFKNDSANGDEFEDLEIPTDI